jgi:GrpB-like predicted nucleotidyltransferase (UPF0157 family)
MLMRVRVVPYDPQWPLEFSLAASEIASATSSPLDLHHIGSTAIPGTHSKPIIDILAVAGDGVALDQLTPHMELLGYESLGEFGIPGRRYFRRDNAAGERTHQVHAFQSGSPQIPRHLAFRDFLQAHAEIARQYSDLKRGLAAAHPNDIGAYMDGKDGFIKEMEARALAWVAAGCDQPAL